MRRLYPLYLLLTWLFLGVAGPASAAQPVATRPGATLLLPYFEVDLGNPSGASTVMDINNASATAVLGHVTVWSDLGIPVLAFNVYLTGYDLQRIDLRDIMNGKLPITASAGQDSGDKISPKGPLSQDINFASCSGQLPLPPVLPAAYITHIQSSLTGKPSSFFGGCAGSNLGDRVARGYVTVDTVNNCTLRVAQDPGYFLNGGGGDATTQNVLWGDFHYVNTGRRVLGSDKLVHIRAEPTDPDLSTPGNYTFYGRFVGWNALDNREPLSTQWAVPYIRTNAPRVVAWRDPKTTPAVASFACGTPPAEFPLPAEDIVAFDTAERAVDLPSPGLPPAFPRAAQAILPGSAGLPAPFASGWYFLNLNHGRSPNPSADPLAAQAWVTLMNNNGRYVAGHGAKRLDSARQASHTKLIP